MPFAPGGQPPPLAAQIAQRGGAIAFDDHAHIVEGTIGPVAALSQRVLARMLRRVPAAGREVEAAHERHAVVDHDHLLVMRRAQRMARVHLEVEARMKPEA